MLHDDNCMHDLEIFKCCRGKDLKYHDYSYTYIAIAIHGCIYIVVCI